MAGAGASFVHGIQWHWSVVIVQKQVPVAAPCVAALLCLVMIGGCGGIVYLHYRCQTGVMLTSTTYRVVCVA